MDFRQDHHCNHWQGAWKLHDPYHLQGLVCLAIDRAKAFATSNYNRNSFKKRSDSTDELAPTNHTDSGEEGLYVAVVSILTAVGVVALVVAWAPIHLYRQVVIVGGPVNRRIEVATVGGDQQSAIGGAAIDV